MEGLYDACPGVKNGGRTMGKLVKRIAVVLVLAASTVGARADEDSAVKAIEKLGGKVCRDTRDPAKPATGVLFLFTSVSNDDLEYLNELKQLQLLDLAGTRITDAGLKELHTLTNLKTLNLSRTRVTDEGLRELKDLKQLQSLFIGGTAVTPEGAADLKKTLPDCKIFH
jgi:internalin A